MACARQDSTVLCRLFGLPDPGPPIKIPTRRTASDPVVGGMSRSQQLDSGLQDRRPLRISKITQNSDPHSRQIFPKRLWRAGENHCHSGSDARGNRPYAVGIFCKPTFHPNHRARNPHPGEGLTPFLGHGFLGPFDSGPSKAFRMASCRTE